MQKTVVIAALACMLFAFPIFCCSIQISEAGNGNRFSISEHLVAQDNSIVGGEIVQVSVVQTGGQSDEESSSDNSSDEPGGNPEESNDGGSNSGDDPGSGDDSGDGSDDGSGDGSGSGNDVDAGGDADDSDGSSSEVTLKYESMVEDQLSNSLTETVVINEIRPGRETAPDGGRGIVELYNTGRNPANVSQWYMKNMAGQVIGTIGNKQIRPHGFLAVNVTGLEGDSQRVALFDSRDNKIDSVIYIGARSHKGSCYARMPDGANVWQWTKCTIRAPNQQGHQGY